MAIRNGVQMDRGRFPGGTTLDPFEMSQAGIQAGRIAQGNPRINIVDQAGTVPQGEAERIASEAEIERQRELAQSFAAKANSNRDIKSVWQGLAHVADSALSGWNERKADTAERERRDAMAKALTGALGSSGLSPDIIEIARNDPDLGRSIIAAQVQQRMAGPKDNTKVIPKGSSIYDPTSGEWISPPVGMSTEIPDFGDIATFRKEIQSLPSYKSYSQAMPIFTTMADAVKRDSKAADLNLVYGLGKIFDPGSVVREGEMVLVQDTAALPDWLVGSINSLNGGARLQPETRMAIIREAQSRMSAYRDAFDADLVQFRGIADRYGIRQDDAIPSLGDMPQLPELATFNQPIPGTVSSPPVVISSDDEYEALPSDTVFVHVSDPNNPRRKP